MTIAGTFRHPPTPPAIQGDFAPLRVAPPVTITEFLQTAAEENLKDLESSVGVRYLNDPLFHHRVIVGARILHHLIPDIEPHVARRAALLVIAASQQEPLRP